MGYIGTLPRPVPVEKRVSGVPVGSIVEVVKGKIPAGYLPMDTEFNALLYPALNSYLGTNRTPKKTHEYRVGDVKWFPKRQHIDSDFVAADGQLLNYADYPEVKEVVSRDGIHQTTQNNFDNDPKFRGFWMTSIPDEFRVPDMNGKLPNTLGSVFVRGDGVKSNENPLIQEDAIRNITGTIAFHGSQSGGTGYTTAASAEGVFEPVSPQTQYANLTGNSGAASIAAAKFMASRVVPTADENRPQNIAGCWAVRVKTSTEFAMKAAGFIENEGLANIVGLVQKDSDLQNQINKINEPKPIISFTNMEDMEEHSEEFNPVFGFESINRGFDYNKATCTVTVKKAGTYRITFGYTCQAIGSGLKSHSTGGISINSTDYFTVCANYFRVADTVADVINTASGTIIKDLRVGDTIRPTIRPVNGTTIKLWFPATFTCEFIQ